MLDRIAVPVNPQMNPDPSSSFRARILRPWNEKQRRARDRTMGGGMGAAGVLSLVDLARLELQGKTPREDYGRERAARKFAETEGQTDYATDRASGKGHKFQGVF
jgi:hypothetical protein|tara:strand:+ start:96 stop:410 length:315 start_codon:yes stop_codon:yes gene_type:complete